MSRVSQFVSLSGTSGSRASGIGCPHHVTQRGNNRQDVFFADDDRRVFLEMLREAAGRFDLKVDGYCLMTNRVHLVATPAGDDSLPDAKSFFSRSR
jgi:putative transposase